MYGKKLAYIVRIKDVVEIPDADRIELVHVLDYTVVVKKGEYKPGELGLYVEVDSILPDGFTPEQKTMYASIKDGSYFKGVEVTKEEKRVVLEQLSAASKYPFFEFLRDKRFKIKSMKLNKFGVVSQGILFKPETLGIVAEKVGQDFTEQFGITECVHDDEEAGLNTSFTNDGCFVKMLMKFAWFRTWRNAHMIKEVWQPTFPSKSDEENVQKIYTDMYEKYANEEWVATEKLEGQNISIFSEQTKGLFGRRRKHIGVCSRTRELRPDGTGRSFWATVKRLGLDKKIKSIPGEWFCRGEHIGPSIQGNIYELPQTDIIFFDFYRKEYCDDMMSKNGSMFRWKKLNYDESVAFAKEHGLPFVPVLDEHYKLPTGTVNNKGVALSGADIMLQQADRNTTFGNNLKHKSEGFVLRLRSDYNVSFKVKNPNYSI